MYAILITALLPQLPASAPSQPNTQSFTPLTRADFPPNYTEGVVIDTESMAVSIHPGTQESIAPHTCLSPMEERRWQAADVDPERRSDHPQTLVSGTTASTLAFVVKQFDGAEQNAYGGTATWVPPSPGIAVSGTHIVEVVNQNISFFTHAGALTFRNLLNSSDPTVGVQGFFEPVGAGPIVFDPNVVFDQETQRFFLVAVEAYGTSLHTTSQAFMDIAVSDDSDPNGAWTLFRLDTKYVHNFFCTSTGTTMTYAAFLDRPSIGVDSQAVYVVGNVFKLSTNCPSFPQGRFVATRIRVLNKASLLGGTATWNDIDGGTDPSLDPFSMQVAQRLTPGTTTHIVNAQFVGVIRVGHITNPLTSPQYVSNDVSVASFSAPTAGLPQLGTTWLLDPFDGRVVSAVEKDQKVYLAHGVSDPDSGGRVLARWYEINTSTAIPTLVQQGNVDPGGDAHTFYPAITVNWQGELGMAYARTSPTELASIGVTGRKPGDPLGQMGPPRSVYASTVSYTESTPSGYPSAAPWGNCFGIAVEVEPSNKFWCVGEWASAGAHWETRIARFKLQTLAGPP